MNYSKLAWALLGTLALGLKAALSDDVMSVEDWVTVGAALLAAVGTWLVPNTPVLAAAKTWVNAFVLGAGVLLPLLPDGLSGPEWWTVVIAVMTAAGVYVLPGPQNRDYRLTAD
jgi:hypothetical protein